MIGKAQGTQAQRRRKFYFLLLSVNESPDEYAEACGKLCRKTRDFLLISNIDQTIEGEKLFLFN